MSKPLGIPIWKTAPLLRLLLPFVAGILLQWYLQPALINVVVALASFSLAYTVFGWLPVAEKFRLGFVQGILLQLILVAGGMLITWNNDVRQQPGWYGHFYKEGDYLVATIQEPLVDKPKSLKADASVELLIHENKPQQVNGRLLLYFSKDSSAPALHYGDQVLINKKLVAIKNSGNPGAFNYERYAAFQQTFHNVFLKSSDWVKLPTSKPQIFQSFLFSARDKILRVLQQYISSGKDELGIAEALLIGYTNDLDKDLVQAYSNTGVVHIIAISGMHLGLIYALLIFLFARLPLIKKSAALQTILILTCLWVFSLLTGGAASVIRSAVMFSFISIGSTFFKKASVFNSLAASGFVMLCYNPYYLWDVGFQLSYLAVAGIVLFQKPLYNLVYVKNKLLDHTWQAISITTAAQVLTFPVCIYYFHQFPLLFLVTNLVAVPLSTLVLYTELFLLAFSFVPFAGIYIGKLAGWLLWLMNSFITNINALPFAVWDGIYANVGTTLLLYACIVCGTAWLIKKNSRWLQWSLAFLAGFIALHQVADWKVFTQQKIIVYNVPQHQAIDFVKGKQYYFAGDTALMQDGLLQNFHLKPGRIALQLNKKSDPVFDGFQQSFFYQFAGKKIMVLDENVFFQNQIKPVDVDMIILSKNTAVPISQLAKVFNCDQFVFDASNSLWKIEKWKQDCDKLNLRYHSVPEQGAFVTDL